MSNILEELKQLPRKNACRGSGIRDTKAMAIDRDMARAARDIAEDSRVTVNSVISLAISSVTSRG
jgi:hypothetical protein